MIEINLIPQKLKKAKQMQLLVMGGVVIAGAIVAGLAGILIMQTKQMADIDSQIKRIDAESSSLQDKIAEVKKYDAADAAFKVKMAIVERLLKDQSFWPEFMDQLSALMLPDMWLTAITQGKDKDDGVIIQVTGRALSKVIVADFIKRLEECPKVMDLAAAKIGEEKYNLMTVSNFDISFTYKKEK